jgi:hypothetical protein
MAGEAIYPKVLAFLQQMTCQQQRLLGIKTNSSAVASETAGKVTGMLLEHFGYTYTSDSTQEPEDTGASGLVYSLTVVAVASLSEQELHTGIIAALEVLQRYHAHSHALIVDGSQAIVDGSQAALKKMTQRKISTIGFLPKQTACRGRSQAQWRFRAMQKKARYGRVATCRGLASARSFMRISR